MLDFERCSWVASARTDEFMRHIANSDVEYTGSQIDWAWGTVSIAKVTSEEIAEWVSEEGDPWLSESRNLMPGWYLIHVTDLGTVFAHFYHGEEDARADYKEIDDYFNSVTTEQEI